MKRAPDLRVAADAFVVRRWTLLDLSSRPWMPLGGELRSLSREQVSRRDPPNGRRRQPKQVGRKTTHPKEERTEGCAHRVASQNTFLSWGHCQRWILRTVDL